MSELVAVLHTASTLGMVLVIWDVQLRRYPAFVDAGADGFAECHRRHVSSISRLVIPLMLAELATGIALLFIDTATSLLWRERLAGVALLAVTWASTFFVQVPLHGRLSNGKDEHAIALLLKTNWVRTLAWSARGALVVAAMAR